MSTNSTFRDEIFRVTHRWHKIFIYCLVGALASLGISLLFPSPYRATKELYVGINIHTQQEIGNTAQNPSLQFTNVDDYKNWQMTSLNSVIFMDSILEETLLALQKQDVFWTRVQREELAQMLHVYWRNAGKWRLVAESNDAQRSLQAVTTWHDVVVERVHAAVNQSRNLMVIDAQIQSLADAQTQIISRQGEMQQLKEGLNAWLANLGQRPAGQILEESGRTQLWMTITQISPNSNWQPFLDVFPGAGSLAEYYLPWLNQMLSLVEQESIKLQTQIATLNVAKEEATVQYAQASQASLGLSENLNVDPITESQPGLSVIRPTGLMLLIGCCLGLILWIIVEVFRISRRQSP